MQAEGNVAQLTMDKGNRTTPIVRARPVQGPSKLPAPGETGPVLGVPDVKLPENMPAYNNAARGSELVATRSENLEQQFASLAAMVDERIAAHLPASQAEAVSAIGQGNGGAARGQALIQHLAVVDARSKAMSEAVAGAVKAATDGMIGEVDAARKQMAEIVAIIERAGLVPSGNRLHDLDKGAVHFGHRRVDFNTFIMGLVVSLSHRQFFLPAAAATPAAAGTLDLTKLLSTGNLYGTNVGSEVMSRYTELLPNAGTAPTFRKGELESTVIEVYRAAKAGAAWTITLVGTIERPGGAQLPLFATTTDPVAVADPTVAGAFVADTITGPGTAPTGTPAAAAVAAAPGAAGLADGTYYIGRHSYRRRILGRIGGSLNFAMIRKILSAGASMAYLPQGAALAPFLSNIVENFMGSATEPTITTSVTATTDALGG